MVSMSPCGLSHSAYLRGRKRGGEGDSGATLLMMEEGKEEEERRKRDGKRRDSWQVHTEIPSPLLSSPFYHAREGDFNERNGPKPPKLFPEKNRACVIFLFFLLSPYFLTARLAQICADFVLPCAARLPTLNGVQITTTYLETRRRYKFSGAISGNNFVSPSLASIFEGQKTGIFHDYEGRHYFFYLTPLSFSCPGTRHET